MEHNSIRDEISGSTLASEIGLMLQKETRVPFIVEGSSDSKFFRRYLQSQSVSLHVAHGKGVVLEAVTKLWSRQQEAIAICDKDYSDLIGYADYDGYVIFTSENDLEVQLIQSPAFNQVLLEFGSRNKVFKNFASIADLKNQIFIEASKLGALRFLSQKCGWRLKFNGMKYKFSTGRCFRIDFDQTLTHIMAYSKIHDQGLKVIIEREVRLLTGKIEPLELVNGHDCMRIIGRALKFEIGNCKDFDDKNGSSSIARIFRLAYERAFFERTGTYLAIRHYEKSCGVEILNQY